MDKEKYLLDRQEMVNQADAFIKENKLEDAEKVMTEITNLDKSFEESSKAFANLKALEDKQPIVNLEDNSIDNKGVVTMDKQPTNVMSKEKLYENAFAKTLMGQELTPIENQTLLEFNNAVTGQTTTNTGVVIPETTMNEIITEIYAQNPFFADARKINIKGTVSIPKHTAITAGDAAGYAEATATVEEVNTFVEIQLGGVEVAKYIEISFKLEAMSIPAFMSYIKQEIVDRVGVELGRQAINGTGATQMKGVLTVLASVTSQNGTYPATGLTYASITGAIAKLGAKHVKSAVLYVDNNTLWNGLANLMDLNGRPLFVPDVNGGGVGRILGIPVKVDTAVPADVLLFADAKGYLINTQEALSVESSRDIKNRKTGFSAYTVLNYQYIPRF